MVSRRRNPCCRVCAPAVVGAPGQVKSSSGSFKTTLLILNILNPFPPTVRGTQCTLIRRMFNCSIRCLSPCGLARWGRRLRFSDSVGGWVGCRASLLLARQKMVTTPASGTHQQFLLYSLSHRMRVRTPPPFQTRINQRHAAPFSTAIADMGVKTLHTPILVFYWQRAEQHRRENDVEQQRTAEVPTHAGGDPASRPTYICEHVPFVMRTREDMVRVNLVRQRSTLRAP